MRVLCRAALVVILALSLAALACAKRQILEVSSTVMYDRPRIERVVHSLVDSREQNGGVVARVEVIGDPGLKASFDINPGIVSGHPMEETTPGHYFGEFPFPSDLAGGPYTLIARLRHEAAGETIWRDPKLITIPLFATQP